ncbi:MAG TPA: hypothetical protein VG184_02585 [Acidimicrobiales bacterium]|jgi:hypothetical protein|nr:hypothetical protein [Acidimicrobiales bacterium]
MMVALHIVLTLFDIVAFVAVLGFFLHHIAGQLRSIAANLAKITFGVRAVETQCAVIGPATDRINDNLAQAASGLHAAATQAEILAGSG